jgi:hypothetical protein
MNHLPAGESEERLRALAEEMEQSKCLFQAFSRAPNAPGKLIGRLAARPGKPALTRDELNDIVRCKQRGMSGTIVRERQLERNDESRVREVTQAAFTTDNIVEAVDLLRSLESVGTAVASAILSWCEPDKWPVIDRRAWAALASFGLLEPHNTNRFSSRDYERYCAVVMELKARVGRSPQAVDRWLYAFDKCHLRPGDSVR